MTEQPSKTALITGASAGLGAEFARQLAAEEYRFVLVARREDRLVQLGEELRSQFDVESESLVADLATSEGVTAVEDRIRRLDDLDLLINNAGFGTFGNYAEVDLRTQLDMLHVHVTAAMRLSRAALDRMIPRGRGYIINVSSLAGFLHGGRSVTYCATKAYLNSFSESLADELHGTGVRVQALCPGFTTTEFHDTRLLEKFDRKNVPNFMWMPADRVVRTSLAARKGSRVIVIPGLLNRCFKELLTSSLLRPVASLLARRTRGD
jgi:short-subunit dehydrogenase